ncbi:MAG: hypothetical protein SWK76_05695 [Actinomycetota bacterium]|nr:hypothetical protein [Actinomycetota bacterium]
MKIDMYGIRTGGLSIAAMLLMSTSLLLSSVSCGGASMEQRVENVEAVLSEGNMRLADTAAFLAALEDFDFDDATFLDNSLNNIALSREADSSLRASLEELGGMDYSGELVQLGVHVSEYRRVMERPSRNWSRS